MNKHKQILKDYNKVLNEEIKKNSVRKIQNMEIDQNIYQVICYYRLNLLLKNKVINNKKYKVLTKLLDAYFEIERNILENNLLKEKLVGRLMKIEVILSKYHLLDEINLTKYIKQDILKKTK